MNPKQPPHNLEAERAVLGGMMLNARASLDVIDALAVDDFYPEQHRLIYAVIQALAADGKAHDIITVSERLRGRGELDAAGGLVYVGELVTDCTSASNVRAYVKIVRAKSIMRSVIAVSQDAAGDAFESDKSPEQILDEAETALFNLRQRGARGQSQMQAFSDLIPQAEEQAQASRHGESSGISTGLADLDRKTGGLFSGDLVIIAGRPGMGKTTLSTNIAEHVAFSGRPTAIFSMEMGAVQIAQRSIAGIARIRMEALKTGQMSEDDYARMAAHGGSLRGLPLYVDETGGLSPMELRARARRAHARHKLGLVVVDYIQLMQVPGTRENRTNEISEISRSLKALAKELQIPVIALSQLSRSVESRDNKRPRMSDLRESGGIEQDADVVLMCYRDDYYNDQSACPGVAEIIIAKQRNGPTGTVLSAFLGEYCRFENLDSGSAHGYFESLNRQKEKPRRGLAQHFGEAA